MNNFQKKSRPPSYNSTKYRITQANRTTKIWQNR